MAEETEYELVHDLGELITTSQALRVADQAIDAAIDRAVRYAGLAVSRISSNDATSMVTARESISACRNLIELLRLEVAKARALNARAQALQDIADLRRRGD